MDELTTIPTQYGFADQGFLAEGLRPGVTTCQISPIYRIENGVRTPRGFNTPAAFIYIELAGEYERASYGVATVDPVTKITTLTAMRRELSQEDGNDFTSQGDGGDWPKGSRIVVSNDPALFGSYALAGGSNVFTAINTFEDKIQFIDANTYIDVDGSGNLILKDANNALRTLTDISAAGSNDKVGISTNDTTPDYLENKVTSGDGIEVTVIDPAGDEGLSLAIDLATDPGLEFNSGALQIKAKPAGGIVVDEDGISVLLESTLTGNYMIGTTNQSTLSRNTSGTTSTNVADASFIGVIPANTLAVGDILLFSIHGLSTVISSTTSFRTIAAYIRLQLNSVTALQTGLSHNGSAASNQSIVGAVSAFGMVTAIGASGVIKFSPSALNAQTSDASVSMANTVDIVTLTLDTTADINMAVNQYINLSGSSTSGSVTVYGVSALKINSST